MSTGSSSVVVLGTGTWATRNHLPWLQARNEVHVVGAYDPNEERLDAVCEQFDIPNAARSLEEALALSPDGVVVASPAGAHAEQVRAALDIGAHVLCEKPFTIEPDEAWSLVAAAEKKDLALLIAHGWNHTAIVRESRDLLRSVGIGKLEHATVHMASYIRDLLTVTSGRADGYSADPQTWTDIAQSGGGYAPGQLSHAVALLLSLTGDRAHRVTALTDQGGGPVDVHDAALVEYRSGAIGTISGASCWPPAAAVEGEEEWPPHQLSIRIYGSEGQFCLDLERDEAWLRRERDDVMRVVSVEPGAGRYSCEGPLEALCAAMAGDDAWRNDTPMDLGPRTVEIISSIVRSAASGTPVTITDTPASSTEPKRSRTSDD